MASGVKNIYRSMNGKEIDMNKLATQNETTVPVGNTKKPNATNLVAATTPAAEVNVNVTRSNKTVVSVPIQNSPARYATLQPAQHDQKSSSKKQ